MKNLLLFLSFSVALLPACTKHAEPPFGEDTGAKSVELHVNLGMPQTKVSAQSETHEKMIRNVQIFVFRAGNGPDAGNLEIAASAGFDTELDLATGSYDGITLRSSTGEREIWAVVNDSQDRTSGADAVATLGDFLAQTHDLRDSRQDKLLMTGTSGTVVLHEGREEVQVDVRRMAASVILESVTHDFSSPAYRKAGVFRVEDCYLLNVPGRVNFGQTYPASALPEEAWYARMSKETSLCEPGLIHDAVTPRTVEYGESDTTPHSFYAYPNDCEFSEDASWCARSTLLVLEASIFNGTEWLKFYYPVAITGGLQANKQYRVNLTIHRPGSLDPNTPVRFSDVTALVRVLDWENGDPYSPEI